MIIFLSALNTNSCAAVMINFAVYHCNTAFNYFQPVISVVCKNTVFKTDSTRPGFKFSPGSLTARKGQIVELNIRTCGNKKICLIKNGITKWRACNYNRFSERITHIGKTQLSYNCNVIQINGITRKQLRKKSFKSIRI